MNISMWLKAVRIIPRLNREEWDGLDIISRWLVAVRAAVLVMTFTSAAVAGLLAARVGQFNLERWLLLVFGLVFAHAANNLINDLTDYKRGVDKNNYFRTLYGPQPVQQGLLSIRQVLLYVAVTGLIAAAAGLPLVIFGGWPAVILMAAGAFFVLFYTWPLKYIGLGEIAVLLIWGPLMVGGGYFVITGTWDWPVALASLTYALGPTTVLFGKHIDKLDQDKARGIHTLPVILGEKAARAVVLAMFALMYVLVIVLIIQGYFSPFMLAVLGAVFFLPRPARMYLQPRPADKPDGWEDGVWPLWFSAASFYHTRIYGLLFLAGLILEIVF